MEESRELVHIEYRHELFFYPIIKVLNGIHGFPPKNLLSELINYSKRRKALAELAKGDNSRIFVQPANSFRYTSPRW